MSRKPMEITRKSVSLPVSMWKDITEYRFSNRIPTEAEAVRRLIEMALEEVKPKGPRRG